LGRRGWGIAEYITIDVDQEDAQEWDTARRRSHQVKALPMIAADAGPRVLTMRPCGLLNSSLQNGFVQVTSTSITNTMFYGDRRLAAALRPSIEEFQH